jgi:hypothetical protein
MPWVVLFSSSSRIYDGYSGHLLWAFTYTYILAFLYSRVAPFSFCWAFILFFSFIGFSNAQWANSCSGVPYVLMQWAVFLWFPSFVLSYKPYLFTPWATVKRASSIYVAGRTPLFLIQCLYFQ